jgi:Acyl-CoA thioester hydrolase/BAAT N-terminal region
VADHEMSLRAVGTVDAMQAQMRVVGPPVCLGMALALIGALVVGCSRPHPTAVLVVVEPVAAFDGPLHLRVERAVAGQPVTIRATTTDQDGLTYQSTATFTADEAGAVDVSTTAPVSGSYTGVSATGLLWSMTPTNGSFFSRSPTPQWWSP